MKTSRILPDFPNSLPAITCCLVASVLLSPSCTKKAGPSRWDARETLDLTKTIEPMVAACLETDAVAAAREEDSADDPAIWLSSKTPSLGVVMGTNKKAGIHVYDLSGKELQFLDVGLVNNMDVRYDFTLGHEHIDIAVASNRSHQSIDFFRIDEQTGKLVFLNRIPVTAAIDEVYGFCLAKHSMNGRFYAIVNGKNGVIEQWELRGDGDTIQGTLVRSLKVPSQPEGMVSDDLLARLYVGEEEVGIWEFDLSPDATTEGLLIESTAVANSPVLAADIEGLALYYRDETSGYLIASSQGNHSYAVFQRERPHTYLGSFSIKDTPALDGVEETDGIDVINLPLGEGFPFGCFIAQDGYNLDASGEPVAQNFKLVSWLEIAKALHLKTETEFSAWK